MTNKKPFSDPRWREWPSKGIITGKGNAPKKVHEGIQKLREQYLKKQSNPDKH